MKKILYTSLSIVIIQCCFAQNYTTIKNDPNIQVQEYLKKSRNQKITGTISIAFGGLVAIAAKNAAKEKSLDDFMAGTMESILSAAFLGTGLIELVSGIKNKHKAKFIMNREHTGAFKTKDQWKLGLTIQL